jgi:hypothetical protein
MQRVLVFALPRLYARSWEKLLYLQPNANPVHTPEKQQIETSASVTTVLPLDNK